MSFGKSCSTLILVSLNLVIFLASVLMLALGLVLVFSPASLLKLSGTHFDIETLLNTSGYNFVLNCGIFMIVLGAIATVISFAGCAGACCECGFLLVIYAAALVVVIMAEIGLIIFAAVYPGVFLNSAESVMYKGLIKEFTSDISLDDQGHLSLQGVDAVSTAWYELQIEFKCCGARNYTDYAASGFVWKTFKDYKSYKVPISCCILKEEGKKPNNTGDFKDFNLCMDNPVAEYTNLNGCVVKVKDQIEELFKKNRPIAIALAVIIILVELLLIIMACTVYNRSD